MAAAVAVTMVALTTTVAAAPIGTMAAAVAATVAAAKDDLFHKKAGTQMRPRFGLLICRLELVPPRIKTGPHPLVCAHRKGRSPQTAMARDKFHAPTSI